MKSKILVWELLVRLTAYYWNHFKDFCSNKMDETTKNSNLFTVITGKWDFIILLIFN